MGQGQEGEGSPELLAQVGVLQRLQKSLDSGPGLLDPDPRSGILVCGFLRVGCLELRLEAELCVFALITTLTLHFGEFPIRIVDMLLVIS